MPHAERDEATRQRRTRKKYDERSKGVREAATRVSARAGTGGGCSQSPDRVGRTYLPPHIQPFHFDPSNLGPDEDNPGTHPIQKQQSVQPPTGSCRKARAATPWEHGSQYKKESAPGQTGHRIAHGTKKGICLTVVLRPAGRDMGIWCSARQLQRSPPAATRHRGSRSRTACRLRCQCQQRQNHHHPDCDLLELAWDAAGPRPRCQAQSPRCRAASGRPSGGAGRSRSSCTRMASARGSCWRRRGLDWRHAKKFGGEANTGREREREREVRE